MTRYAVVSANPGSQDGGKIVLYDSAVDGKYNLAHVIAHEMAHSIFDKWTPNQLAEYASAGDWVGTEVLGKVIYSQRPTSLYWLSLQKIRITQRVMPQLLGGVLP